LELKKSDNTNKVEQKKEDEKDQKLNNLFEEMTFKNSLLVSNATSIQDKTKR
jgi:hypothetical protein